MEGQVGTSGHVRTGRRSHRTWQAAAVAVALVLMLAGGLALAGAGSGAGEPVKVPASAGEPRIENVVLILADDLDWAVFNAVPRLQSLTKQGMTFTSFSVTESLCCPSRVSIMRSQYVHNHQVVSNTEQTGGGWPTFEAKGLSEDCLPTWLSDAGVRTGMVGKYLNEYPGRGQDMGPIPAGWDYWAVPASGNAAYSGYNYAMNVNGELVSRGEEPTDFLNDVLDGYAVEFIQTSDEPFFLQLSSFLPHSPAPVAPRHVGSHAGQTIPAGPAYGVKVKDSPAWMDKLTPVGPKQARKLNEQWQQRLESAESLADSVEQVQAALKASGHADDTLVVITSDNGYHLGTHGLSKGKRTAFDTDTLVPAVFIGPGIRPGAVVDSLASTTDLGPTFSQLLGAEVPEWVDGRSLTSILSTGKAPEDWRTAVLSESLGQSVPGDPDYTKEDPPRFGSVRTGRWLFVRYENGQEELYDRNMDPYQLVNLAGSAPEQLLQGLRGLLDDLSTCAGPTCFSAENSWQD